MVKGQWVGKEWVRVGDLIYDIEHKGELVATLNTMREVWRYYVKVRDQYLTQGWRNLGIGDAGLTLYRGEERAEWRTSVRKRENQT